VQEARAGALTAQEESLPGDGMLALMRELYPICRSLTGDGVRETLRIVSHVLPLDVHEVATGTQIFDWAVPREWNIRDAYIADSGGRRVVDFASSNLHVLGYSVPVRTTMSGRELQPRLHSLPDHPDWIPARTAYWAETWGFCLSERQRREIVEDEIYEVVIDSTLEPGHLTYAEALLPGEREEEILLSTYVCHPSLCNDNLSGIAVLSHLGARLEKEARRYSYRLLFSPGTVGPLAWLSRNLDRIPRIAGGLAISCVGDPGPLRYKRSRRGNSPVDRAAELAVRSRAGAIVDDFVPWGGDERQFCSPGFDLSVGALTRTPHGLYPEYHTSADDFSLVRADSLLDSLAAALEIVEVLERDRTYRNLAPYGEPQLGRRGLYREISAGAPRDDEIPQRARLWVLNQSDGSHSLVDIAERARLPFPAVADAAAELLAAGLLEEVA
jgi:aminopeptidase-like protein